MTSCCSISRKICWRRSMVERAYFLADAKIKHHEKSSTRSWFATRIFFRDLLVYCRVRFGLTRMLLLWLLSRPVYWLMWLKNR